MPSNTTFLRHDVARDEMWLHDPALPLTTRWKRHILRRCGAHICAIRPAADVLWLPVLAPRFHFIGACFQR